MILCGVHKRTAVFPFPIYEKRPFKPDNIDCNYMTYARFHSVCPVLGRLLLHNIIITTVMLLLRSDRVCDGTTKRRHFAIYKIIIAIFYINIKILYTVISGSKYFLNLLVINCIIFVQFWCRKLFTIKLRYNVVE